MEPKTIVIIALIVMVVAGITVCAHYVGWKRGIALAESMLYRVRVLTIYKDSVAYARVYYTRHANEPVKDDDDEHNMFLRYLEMAGWGTNMFNPIIFRKSLAEEGYRDVTVTHGDAEEIP
jgi:hypothetical protein